jgi:hypothetical protein
MTRCFHQIIIFLSFSLFLFFRTFQLSFRRRTKLLGPSVIAHLDQFTDFDNRPQQTSGSHSSSLSEWIILAFFASGVEKSSCILSISPFNVHSSYPSLILSGFNWNKILRPGPQSQQSLPVALHPDPSQRFSRDELKPGSRKKEPEKTMTVMTRSRKL